MIGVSSSNFIAVMVSIVSGRNRFVIFLVYVFVENLKNMPDIQAKGEQCIARISIQIGDILPLISQDVIPVPEPDRTILTESNHCFWFHDISSVAISSAGSNRRAFKFVKACKLNGVLIPYERFPDSSAKPVDDIRSGFSTSTVAGKIELGKITVK